MFDFHCQMHYEAKPDSAEKRKKIRKVERENKVYGRRVERQKRIKSKEGKKRENKNNIEEMKIEKEKSS